MSSLATVAIIAQYGDCLMEILEGPIPSVADALTDWGINVTDDELSALVANGGAFTSDDLNADYAVIRYSDYSG